MGSPYGIKCYALLSNVTVLSRIVDTLCSGKKTAKQVPLRPDCVLLRTRIQPPCLSQCADLLRACSAEKGHAHLSLCSEAKSIPSTGARYGRAPSGNVEI